MYPNLERWVYPDHYFGDDYLDYYVVISKHRNSSIAEKSNFDTVIALLEDNGIDDYIYPTFNHYLVGWIQSIMIKETNIKGLTIANEIMGRLEDYPLLDDDDYFSKQREKAEEILRNDVYNKNGLYSYYGEKNVKECMKHLCGNRNPKTIRELRKRDVLEIIEMLMDD